jgi:hypothetical protein
LLLSATVLKGYIEETPMRKSVIAYLLAVPAIASVAARADDLQPPPWRGAPLTTVAEYEFSIPASFGVAWFPDGTIPAVTGDSGGDPGIIAPGFALFPNPGQGAWIPFDGTGALVGGSLINNMEINVPQLAR